MVFAFLLLGACLFWRARRSQRLAERWRVGADSERAVQHALKGPAGSGWVVRNGVPWPGGGDIDHLVRSPAGVGFAIETKTRTFSEEHLRRTAATARWASRRRRRYPAGVVPVLCVVRARGVESRYGDVVVVSLDRLVAVLERAAFSASRPSRRSDSGGGNGGSAPRNAWTSTHSALEWRSATMVNDDREEELGRAPVGHQALERPHDDNPHIKLDGPTRRLFDDSELEPLAAMIRHSLANEVVNRYVNEALRALPEHWIRMAGVYLPDVGSPLRYLAVGPTGAFILTPTNGRWTRDALLEIERAARALDRLLPAHDFSPSRIRLVFAPNHPTLRPQVLGIPGARRIWLIKADELYAHLITHAGAGPCRADLDRLHRALVAKLPASTCEVRPWPAIGGMDSPDMGRPAFDD